MTGRDPFVDARTSVELWELLQTDAGLQPGDYDEHVERELRKELGLGAGPMANELTAHAVSVERFVAAFFVVAEPFVRMWSDLLVLFERAAATAGDANLRVEYRFGEDQPALDFDLNHFRSVLATAERVMARFDLSSDDLPSRLWAVFHALGGRPRFGSATGFDDVDRFARRCEDRAAPWPEAMPARRASTLAALDELLAEAWELAEVVLGAIRSISSTYETLMALPWDDDRPVGAGGAARSKLRLAQSDFWLPTIVVALTRAASRPPSPSAPTSTKAEERSAAPQDVADALDAALAPLRNRDPRRSEPQQRLSEFLQLPIWRQRCELYSNWVCTQLVAALEDREPRVHADGDRIEFSFSGTHLATFDAFTPRLHIWTELRTPLANPVSEGPRKGAIKPDILLLSDPITARRAPLVVECKQYKRANNKKFAAAITDYGHGHPSAEIVLVDYGRARTEGVLEHVASDVRPRATVIGELHPGQRDQIDAFRTAVRRAVGIAEQPSPYTPLSSSDAARVTLRWGAAPADLDLHIRLAFPDGRSEQVNYKEMGSLDEHPFCILENDCRRGYGPETVTIARWLPATYTIMVHNFSEDPPLTGGDSTVTVELDGRTREFHCPDDLDGDEWVVCTIDGLTQQLL